ncbi:MAG TPA: DUF983 domain-containing protein [Bauldia sp.]|nr:DUF983 domain-containing protein [Bauldia sp.]
MTIAHDHALELAPPRPLFPAMLRGFIGRCPNCCKGHLFRAFLKPVAHCEVCGEDYTHQRADDAPPYFTMVIVGHLLVPVLLAVQLTTELTIAQHLMIWLPLTAILTVGLLQPVKGAIVALQWALRMHGFDGRGEETDGQSFPYSGFTTE